MMEKETKRTRVLEMMLKDGFVKVQQMTQHISDYRKGTQGLLYDEQRDIIVRTYDLKLEEGGGENA